MYCPGQGFKPESTERVSLEVRALCGKDEPEEALGMASGDF